MSITDMILVLIIVGTVVASGVGFYIHNKKED